MLKIASAFGMCDSLSGTPAQQKIETAVLLAKTKDGTKLNDIYNLVNLVGQYLDGNLEK